ncbi:MAG: Crp/Fnr family transcriptional regulator [Desulfobacterales bacterium]|nr:Crp/Fnr family transcriptional regulator [Desulfobacterales bacterium]
MSTDIQTLKSLDLFSAFSNEELGFLVEIIDPLKVTEGEILTQRGTPATTFFIIISGNFMVSFKNGHAFTLHEKGNVIGWSTVVTPFNYTGTATALTDGEVLTISGDELLRIVQEDAPLAQKFMEKINKVVEERSPFVTGKIAGTSETTDNSEV